MKLRLLLLFLIVLSPLHASAIERPPRLSAYGWLLVDSSTGSVLAEHRADQRLAPASTTKLMTAYLVFEKLRAGKIHLNDRVVISHFAAKQRGSRLRLRAGEEVTVEDLLKAMLVRSANDATTALAEHAAGSEFQFVAEMNARVRAWGMTGTTFMNPTGLDAPGHLSTARDLSRIAAALIRDFPMYYHWFSLRNYEHNNRVLYNSNRLLWRDTLVDGMKTGYTAQAGWCLVSSAQHMQTRLIATVLGAGSDRGRVDASKRLLDYGFRNFETRLVYAANHPAMQARVWLGESALVPLGVPENLYVTLPRGMHSRVQAQLAINDDLYAPVRPGQRLGMLTLQLDNRVYAQYPLVALKEIQPGGLVQRAIDNIQLMMR